VDFRLYYGVGDGDGCALVQLKQRLQLWSNPFLPPVSDNVQPVVLYDDFTLRSNLFVVLHLALVEVD